MFALTLKHPWPWAILRLGKDIENRVWRPRPLGVGDHFAIHGGVAPKGEDGLAAVACEGRELIGRFGPPPGCEDVVLRDVILPGIVAVARFGGCVVASRSPWFEGPVGWRLHDVTALPEAVPCKGAQGLWPVPEDVLMRVREQYRAAKGGGSR